MYGIYIYTYIHIYHKNQPNSNVGKHNSLMDPMGNLSFFVANKTSLASCTGISSLFSCVQPRSSEVYLHVGTGPKTWRSFDSQVDGSQNMEAPKKVEKNMEGPKKVD